ncbi:MAG: hypothetical protein Q8R78_02405 [Candidatus Omnitrophota bacterium]|nr:hypothetical protein [Candidatus Omnitrophota bacterium]
MTQERMAKWLLSQLEAAQAENRQLRAALQRLVEALEERHGREECSACGRNQMIRTHHACCPLLAARALLAKEAGA